MKWDCKMPSCSNVKSDEVGCQEDKDVCSDTRNLSACDETPLKRLDEAEDEDEEDEDVDFNPFLKETLSPEASSSLSSEVEGLDGNAIESGVAGINLVTLASDGHNCDGESEHGDEEVVMQTTVSSERLYDKDTRGIVDADPGSEAVQEKENSSGSRTDVNDAGQGELIDRNIPKPAIDLDTDDAICTRTRARYSLASFTLDELETFLQETDDEDDLQNVDDEEEYRKFLAFVLHGGDGDGCLAQDNEIIDDDEDNDADFEIELEEALESDIDENTKDKTKMEYERGGRRPQTRQNRHQKSNGQSKKKTSTPTKRPLRPLLPVLANVPMSPFSAQDGMMPETTPGSLTSVQDGYNSGFTQHQIGQLHCLIHEHVQLLIQVFCMCVHDSSRQHIASQVQKLIFEMLNKRNEVLAWKTTSYPNTCFCPQYLYPSVSNNIPTLLPTPCALDTNATDEVCSPSNETASWRSGYAPTGQNGSLWNLEGVFWAPQINGPVTTILDVAPLSLAGKFINDVETAVKENRVRNMESSCETRFEKEPLFPLSGCQSITQANSEVPSSPSQQPRKKTLAATLVENTKKQSIALVPKAVMKLAQIFFPLFNPAFYPHKPPAAAVSNRVLFTDSEDELLALGIWEYNTDWKAIQQRFLPCKSKHQIFVRQKNRCSSKAPENSIKAVRRMKTSPLTAEEIACIHEGLRYFKCNWSFVWQFIVPHRDPSLLPRQWRLALGTQKSYKLDAEAKERRRLYEKSRRGKSAGSASWQNAEKTRVEKIVGENNNAEDNVGKTYVHEAFLADWRPSGSNGHTFPNLATNLRADMLSQGVLHGSGQRPQPLVGNTQQFTHPHPSFHFAGVRQLGPEAIKSNISASKTTLNTYKPQYYLQAYRARKPYGKNLVKLAPGLPPVNLPPSVRVVSQSAFRDSQHGASLSVSAARKESIVCEAPNAGRSQGPHVTKAGEKISNSPNHRCTISHTEDSEIANDKRIEDERSNDSDLQMHPLLFQAPEDGHLPYFQLGSGASSSSSFSFFSGNQPQLNLSLLHNPQQESQVGFPGSVHSTESASLSHGIDFHPLLQRTDYTQLRYPFGSVQMQSLANAEPHSTGKTAGKANELDLDIHLSSMSRKERSFKPANSKSNVHDSRFTTETQTSDSLFYQPSGDPLPNSSNLGSGSNSPVLPTEDVHRYLDDMCDQSNPGIVMEQEELSDSEEENEENVEFECEEMTDSEGDEGSGCEQITEMQIEEEPNLAAEKSNTDSEPRTRSHPHRNLSDPGKNTPSLELGLIRQGKDDGNNSSWLRLDSSGAPHCPVSTTGKGHEDSTIKADNLAAKSLALSRPSRSCTKKSLNTDQLVAERRRAVDRNRQIGSAPRIPISRKPRKQARRNDASLNIELNVKKTNCDGEDKVS